MITLKLPTEPYWIDLTDGVRLHVRPCDTKMVVSARAASSSAVRDALEAIASIERIGGSVAGIDLSDQDDIAGISQFAYVKTLARLAIRDWEGVVDDNGDPLPVTQENVEALMNHPDIADLFIDRYTAPFDERRVEGKGSGTSPDGAMAQVPNTAPDAGRPAPGAPEAGAA